MTDEKSSPAKQKAGVTPTSDTFGLVVAAVFDMQRQLGELMHDMKSMNANNERQHEDNQKLELRLNNMTRTMYAGWILLVVLGTMGSFTIYRVWELILPALQTKLGLPTK